MRYPSEHKQQTREKIVKAAARRFCSRGSERAGIGDLMRDLHLTHGGVCTHFLSKEETFVAAFEHGLKQLAHPPDSTLKHAPKSGEVTGPLHCYFRL